MKLETLNKANELNKELNESESFVNHLQTLLSKGKRLLIKVSGEDEKFYLGHEYVNAMLEIAQNKIESIKTEFEAL